MSIFKIFTDGGARGNPGPAASACVIFHEEKQVFQASKYLGETTNNIAEYRGVLLALDTIEQNIEEEKGKVELHFNLDSLLVVSQLNGKFKIKNAALGELANEIKNILRSFKSVTFTYVPRAKNELADKLVNNCLDENKL